MTREEAIAQLKMDRDLCNFNPMTGKEEPMNEDCRKSAEALDMAIKTLEQQPCEDIISRQAAIDVAKQYWYKPDIAKALEELPSAQFEERKESLCKKVRALCEESKIEFFFVGGGESTWSVTNDKHIKKIVECHKAQLSQEGTTKDATSDTISRQAAIEALQG